jgi:hypothetical protein
MTTHVTIRIQQADFDIGREVAALTRAAPISAPW